MRILLDHCVDWRFFRYLPGHNVKSTRAMGWEALKNGELLAAAQLQFDVFLTVDQNIPYQQSMSGRPISLAIFAPDLLNLLSTVLPGQVYRLPVSRPNITEEAANTDQTLAVPNQASESQSAEGNT